MRRYLPALVLFALSPLLAEVLFGATTLSRIGGLVPVSLLYGGGAVLIRELARRRGGGWGRIVLLGAAYGIVEEGLAIQSLFNPDLFNAGLLGGRALGVNWVWAQWTLGYHAVWSITLPILLTELLFPARRDEPWLGAAGVAAAGAVYAVGALAVGAIFWLVITPGFRAPAALLAGAALLAAGLVVLALAWPRRSAADAACAPAKDAPGAWAVGALAAVAAVVWFALLGLPHPVRDSAPLLLLATAGIFGLAAGVARQVQRWSAGGGWGDSQRLALVWGPLLASMFFGFFFVTAGNRVDQIGQGVASLVALALLARFAWRLKRGRDARPAAAPRHA